ncbi:MAG: helix-turn-helix transcriptional regulator [Bacteroidetes bacterium]|nr:helix-turn-helix transcriptional regulator [Bacteroidota bacterium]
MKKQQLKVYDFDDILDEHYGKRGNEKREAFEEEVKIAALGDVIKQARKRKHLTQEKLGVLVGVQKAQISKLENNLSDARFYTVIKIFEALELTFKMNKGEMELSK